MLRRVNITLNNVRGERVSVNDLTVTGCYDPTGGPTFRSMPLVFNDLRLEETIRLSLLKHADFLSLRTFIQCTELFPGTKLLIVAIYPKRP